MYVYVVLALSSALVGEAWSGCTSAKRSQLPDNLMAKLNGLDGLRFSAKDFTGSEMTEGHYSYSIGICTDAADDLTPAQKFASVIQTDYLGTQKVVGRYNETEIMGGNDWIFLQYEGGETYHATHCGGEARRAHIFISCDPKQTVGSARILEEVRDKSEDCYYLFELEHIAACPITKAPGLSVGSIIVIIVIVVVAVYLIGGTLFNRFYMGAKGLEQIPNYGFWRDFGNLQADGCALICRCGDGNSESRQYRGLGDDQLDKEVDFTVDEDENLLPM